VFFSEIHLPFLLKNIFRSVTIKSVPNIPQESEGRKSLMIIYECEDYKGMSRRAANIISAQVILKPNCVLGLATGSTPIATYSQLADWVAKKDLSFAKVRSVNLDEYKGLTPEHPQSYRYFMNKHFFHLVDIDLKNTHVPSGLATDLEAECKNYDALIESLGGIDLQLLGLGRNGHIGFNEPADTFTLGTHVVELTQSTIEANKRFFASEKDVPRQAITMGVKQIMQARRIVVVASGVDKADAISKVFNGCVDPQVPASILQVHPNCILVADKEALSKLRDRSAIVSI